jgi:hypothetical protein
MISTVMIVGAIVAIWLFIVAEAITYQARHLGDHSAWDSSN